MGFSGLKCPLLTHRAWGGGGIGGGGGGGGGGLEYQRFLGKAVKDFMSSCVNNGTVAYRKREGDGSFGLCGWWAMPSRATLLPATPAVTS